MSTALNISLVLSLAKFFFLVSEPVAEGLFLVYRVGVVLVEQLERVDGHGLDFFGKVLFSVVRIAHFVRITSNYLPG